MAEHTVAELRLRIQAPPESHSTAVDHSERFVRSLLAIAADRLESRYPGRIIVLRTLPLLWTGPLTELRDDASIEEYAEQLVERLEELAASVNADSFDPNVAVFVDESHYWARYFASMNGAAEPQHWVFNQLRAQNVSFAALAGREGAFVLQVLRHLGRLRSLVDVLSRQPPRDIERLCSLLQISTFGADGFAREELSAPLRDYLGKAAWQRLRAFSQTLPDALTPEASLLVLSVEAGALINRPPHDRDVQSLVSLLTTSQLESSDPVALRSADATARGAPELDQRAGRIEQSSELRHTQFGGLFYLLSLVQELQIAETLWKACLPEGTVLTKCAAAMLGDGGADDPAPLLFGGVDSLSLSLPPISDEQSQEISAVILQGLVAAIPRRGLALYPEVIVGLLDYRGDRLLAAVAGASPFAIFLRPAPDAASVQAEIGAFLKYWPGAPAVLASPELAQVDRTGRLQPSYNFRTPQNVFLAPAASASETALLGQVAGVMGYLFEARVQEGFSSTMQSFVQTCLAHPARIERSPREMRIVFDSSAIHIPVRRAGLDHDPGWVPWLNREVRFVFDVFEL